MFKIPSTGGSREKAAGASTREKVQLAVMAALVLVILGWWAAQRAKKADQKPTEAPYAVEDMAEDDGTSLLSRDAVTKLKDKVEGKDAEGAEPASGEDGEKNLGFGKWREKTVDEISPEEKDWALEAGRAEEAERAKFLPMLADFKPLEPDAVYAYRTRVMNRVPVKAQASFTLPDGPDVRHEVVKADGSGLTARRPDGTERKFTWDEVPVESLYAMGEQIAVLDGPRADVKDAFFLAQLAALAGEPDEAAKYRERTVELDPELAGRVPSEPTTSIDSGVLGEFSWPWDDPMRPTPREASSIRGDAPSIFHVYRYARTLGPEKLAAQAERPTKYELLQRRPVNYRGRVYTIKGRFIRRYKSTRWTQIDGHEEAGIQDIDFCFVRGAQWSGIYLVSVPQDTREFGSSDMIRFTGVYIRRWPYLSHGKWEWIPWIAALDMEKVEIAPSRGIRIIGMSILGVTIVGVIVAFFFARRESKQAAAGRDHRVARQRAQRDRIRRKVSEAGKEDDAGKKPG